jgi:hypothetical protein
VTTPCTGAGGSGTKYTYPQLEGLWINAGGPTAVAYIAAAIALAESGGCTAALNLTDNNGTQTSVGLWQTSNGTHSYPSTWSTAAGNATEAVAKYKGAGNSFSPWGTYDSGAYKQYLNSGTTPDTSVPSPSTTGNTPGTSGTTSTCLIAAPSVNLVFFSLGGQCLLGKPQARAIVGAAIIAGGFVTLGVGLLVLAAFGLKSAGAGRVAGTALEAAGAGAVLFGAPEVGAVVAGAGHQVRKHGGGGRQSTAGQYATRRGSQARRQTRHDESVAKQVEGRKRDSAKGPALRDTEPAPF